MAQQEPGSSAQKGPTEACHRGVITDQCFRRPCTVSFRSAKRGRSAPYRNIRGSGLGKIRARSSPLTRGAQPPSTPPPPRRHSGLREKSHCSASVPLSQLNGCVARAALGNEAASTLAPPSRPQLWPDDPCFLLPEPSSHALRQPGQGSQRRVAARCASFPKALGTLEHAGVLTVERNRVSRRP